MIELAHCDTFAELVEVEHTVAVGVIHLMNVANDSRGETWRARSFKEIFPWTE